MQPNKTLATISVLLCVVITSGCAADTADDAEVATPTETTTTSAVRSASPLPSVPVSDGDLASLRTSEPLPVRLRVPSIGVDAQVVPAGLTANGSEMDVPEVDFVGWYQYGSRPNEAGSTLMAGHVDGEGRRGVFWALRDVEQGDAVEVVSGAETKRYRAVSVIKVSKSALPAEAFRRDGAEVLTLVTCGGRFDRTTGHYEDNIVATAAPI